MTCTVNCGGYTVYYLQNDRQYVKKAVNALCELMQTDNEGADISFYVGDVKAPECIAQRVLDGYVISQKGNVVLLKGSNAENTYLATTRYINVLIRKSVEKLKNTVHKELFVSYSAKREEYIADINRFQPLWQYQWRPPAWMTDYEEKLYSMAEVGGRTICYAHRGDLEHYPENSIEGIISAIKKGADLVEVDVYLSADGVPVLNHGTDLESTTDWREKNGTVVDGVRLPTERDLTKWTYDQLKRLRLRTGNGGYSSSDCEITDYRIATLTEVFTVCNDRILVLIDKLPYAHWDLVFDIIKQTGACRSFCYTDLARSPEQAMEMKQRVLDEFGVSGPTMWERGMSWSGTWFDELSLTTDEEFERYYSEQAAKGSFLMSNRVSKLVEYIDRHFGPRK